MDPINQTGPSLPQADGAVPATPPENTAPATPPQPVDQPVVITPNTSTPEMGTVDAPQTPAPVSSENTGAASATNAPIVDTAATDSASNVAPMAEPWPGPDSVQLPTSGAPEASTPAAPTEEPKTPEQPAV
jgi:hypothetical protein